MGVPAGACASVSPAKRSGVLPVAKRRASAIWLAESTLTT
ncbi:Uncharacterised protein [Bordetella pertussis]|nr:Uncharacterised protein [Bordetella pertussis]